MIHSNVVNLLRGFISTAAILMLFLPMPSVATEMLGDIVDTTARIPKPSDQIKSQQIEREENLFIFVFKNGSSQMGITVKVGEEERVTNRFGFAAFLLPEDTYEVGYYQNGSLFAIADVDLVGELKSQIFLSLTSSGAEAEFDLPLSEFQQSFDLSEIKEQTGPTGTLKLSVKDASDGAPIVNAKLFFKGYSVEATTNSLGVAEVELSGDSYDISVVHPNYVMTVIKDVEVNPNSVTEQSSVLTKSDIVLEEYVVTAPVVEGSLAASFSNMRESSALTDSIGSEQFSKSGDSSASGALKRVTGVTVVGEKYVFVRGLGERYSSLLLNGLSVPSPEPTKRVVPLDIFPTDVIQSLEIQKTYSSDLPGTFAGGTVSINTKDVPKEDNFIKGSIGLSYDGSTGDTGFYGSDNSEPMPDIILQLSDGFSPLDDEVAIGDLVLSEGLSSQERLELDTALASYRSYGQDRKTIKPGSSLSGSIGQSFKTRNGFKYGFVANAYYKADEQYKEIETDEYAFNPTTGSVELRENKLYQAVELDEKLGGLMSVTGESITGQKIKYTYLHVIQNQEITNFIDQFDVVEDRPSTRTFLQYTERNLTSHQFNGFHPIGEDRGRLLDDLEISWGLATSEATRLEPGTFEYEYKFDIGTSDLVIDAEKLFYLYSDLKDEEDNLRLDFKLPYFLFGREAHSEFGYYDRDKERQLDNRRFKWSYSETRDPSDIDDALTVENAQTDTLDIVAAYRADDAYTATQNLDAIYFQQMLAPIEKLDLNFGVRRENSEQRLEFGEADTDYGLTTNATLPYLTATYRLKDSHQIRFGFSETLSRPDFREFSVNRYKDPITGYIVFGFEGLEATSITNLDLKYEWFPSYDEFYSFGLFSKDFEDPIESVRSRADEDIEITYRNAESAESVGAEIGFRKRLDNVWEKLNHMFVSGNYAYIDSEISLNKAGNATDPFISRLTSDKRPMQGQSPYVFNLKVGYDNFYTRRSAVLLYNVYGERISTLGIDRNPDIYEDPFRRLDFVMKWGLNDTYDDQRKKIGYTLSVKAKNLLDSERTFSQGGVEVERYNPGRSISVSISAKY